MIFLIVVNVILLTLVFLVIKALQGTAICMDSACDYGKKICCMQCRKRRTCSIVCEYKGKCDWRQRQ